MPTITAIGQTTGRLYTSGQKTDDNELLVFILIVDPVYNFTNVVVTSTLGTASFTIQPDPIIGQQVAVVQDSPVPLPELGQQTITFKITTRPTATDPDPFIITYVQPFETGEATVSTIKAAENFLTSGSGVALNLDDLNCLALTVAFRGLQPDRDRTNLRRARDALGCFPFNK
jgi:hypothetical protein